MPNDEDGEKAAGKLSKRKLEKAIEDADSLISQGENPGLAAPGSNSDLLNSIWTGDWFTGCEELSESVENKALQKALNIRPEDMTELYTPDLGSMRQTLKRVKRFLEDSLEDLKNQEEAEKARDEAEKKAKDEAEKKAKEVAATKARDAEPEKELVDPSLPDVVKCMGRLGIRQDPNGYTTVRFHNNLPRDQDDKLTISGRCEFMFKDLRTDEPEKVEKGKPNPEEVNLDDAVIPVHSILVFEPTDQKRCVSEFRVRLLIKKNGNLERELKFRYKDPGSGKCYTKVKFQCVDK